MASFGSRNFKRVYDIQHPSFCQTLRDLVIEVRLSQVAAFGDVLRKSELVSSWPKLTFHRVKAELH